MKQILTLLLISAGINCSAATGSASDAKIFAGAIIVFVLLIAASGYFIDLMKKKIKEARIKKTSRAKENFDEEDLMNSFLVKIPGAGV